MTDKNKKTPQSSSSEIGEKLGSGFIEAITEEIETLKKEGHPIYIERDGKVIDVGPELRAQKI